MKSPNSFISLFLFALGSLASPIESLASPIDIPVRFEGLVQYNVNGAVTAIIHNGTFSANSLHTRDDYGTFTGFIYSDKCDGNTEHYSWNAHKGDCYEYWKDGRVFDMWSIGPGCGGTLWGVPCNEHKSTIPFTTPLTPNWCAAGPSGRAIKSFIPWNCS